MRAVPWEEPADTQDARRIQEQLRNQIVRSGEVLPDDVRTIAGIDASITRGGSRMIGSICLLSWPDLDLKEVILETDKVTFPYIPGYLSFREIPVLLKAAARLKVAVDLAIVDGQGVAHPRRLGLASHFGLVTGWRTIGCAKSRLIGIFGDIGGSRGSKCALYDGEERIGTVLRTRQNVSPVWVSVGHGLSLDQAEAWVLRTASRYRLPEPIRCAHRKAGEYRRTL